MKAGQVEPTPRRRALPGRRSPAAQPMSPDELLGKVTALYLKDQIVGHDVQRSWNADAIGR